jgi:cellulase/cellobiase CelA1
VQGDGITYQLVQRDPGYYEGKFVVTNRTGRPMTDWTLTFQVPGGNVKNIWGARLTRGGAAVEIRNLENARPIPPGATWEVQFGAEGAATDPSGCRLNGEPCGF